MKNQQENITDNIMMLNKHMSPKLAQFHLIKAIRTYFESQGFLDVLTPPMVENPGMETHLHPFGVYSAHTQEKYNLYLHTSPEFYMKELLSESVNNQELKKIFTISYVFRDEPKSDTHRPQFLMLEWYRAYEYYDRLIDDICELIPFVTTYLAKKGHPLKQTIQKTPVQTFTMREIFHQYLDIDLYQYLTKDRLYHYIKDQHPEIPLYAPPENLSFDDCFFLLFLNAIEPKLKEFPFVVIKEFPHQLSALSTIKKDDSNVCERFELYSYGIEIANAFHELTDLELQKERFRQEAKNKKRLYGYQLPPPNTLYNALERGLPPSSGIALGIERLLMSLLDLENPFWD